MSVCTVLAWGGAEAAGLCCACCCCTGRSLVPALMDELRQAGMLHVLVVVGGIIPPQVSEKQQRRVAGRETHTHTHALPRRRSCAHTPCVVPIQSATTAPQPAPLPVFVPVCMSLLAWCCTHCHCPQDHEELYSMGVAAIFGPGTRIPAAALDMIQLLVGGDEEGDPQQQQGAADG